MALSDYAHHNEDAMHMWWGEEGRHGSEEPDYDPDDFLPQYDDDDEYDEDEDDFEGGEDAHLEAAYEDRFAMEDY
jgi:hypothetical protein